MGDKYDSKKIKKIVFACGGAKSLLPNLISRDIDLLVTGELGYHELLFCELNNIPVYLLGHKNSEIFILAEIKDRLQKKFESLKIIVLN